MKPYMKLICDYAFSDKRLSQYSKNQQMILNFAVDVLTTHGSGGKFMERLIQAKFKLVDDGEIHGWDGKTKQNRPVEIKTETVNDSMKLSCAASFHQTTRLSKRDLYLKETPILINVGICNVTGKCIYVMFTDTRILKENGNLKLFDMLDGRYPNPRTNFGHWCNEPTAFDVKYKNLELVNRHYKSIHKKLRKELEYLHSPAGRDLALGREFVEFLTGWHRQGIISLVPPRENSQKFQEHKMAKTLQSPVIAVS